MCCNTPSLYKALAFSPWRNAFIYSKSPVFKFKIPQSLFVVILNRKYSVSFFQSQISGSNWCCRMLQLGTFRTCKFLIPSDSPLAALCPRLGPGAEMTYSNVSHWQVMFGPDRNPSLPLTQALTWTRISEYHWQVYNFKLNCRECHWVIHWYFKLLPLSRSCSAFRLGNFHYWWRGSNGGSTLKVPVNLLGLSSSLAPLRDGFEMRLASCNAHTQERAKGFSLFCSRNQQQVVVLGKINWHDLRPLALPVYAWLTIECL